MRSMADIDIPPEEDEEDECAHEWSRVLFAPKVMRESWPDGQRMKTDQSYANFARAAQLEVEKLDHRPGSTTRKDIEKEVRVLNGKDKTKSTKGPNP